MRVAVPASPIVGSPIWSPPAAGSRHSRACTSPSAVRCRHGPGSGPLSCTPGRTRRSATHRRDFCGVSPENRRSSMSAFPTTGMRTTSRAFECTGHELCDRRIPIHGLLLAARLSSARCWTSWRNRRPRRERWPWLLTRSVIGSRRPRRCVWPSTSAVVPVAGRDPGCVAGLACRRPLGPRAARRRTTPPTWLACRNSPGTAAGGRLGVPRRCHRGMAAACRARRPTRP